jgi:hypothetical protein
MKNIWKAFIVLILGLSLISGCGTKVDDEQANQNTTIKEDNEKTNGSSSENEQNKENEQAVRLLEKQLSYTIDGKTYEETAFLKTSDNQEFSIYTFEGWELEAEEPNSDVLLKDDSFVRIRLVDPTTEIDYTKLVEDHAKAVSSEIHRVETADLNGILKNAVWWKAYTEDTAVNVLWIKEKIPMLLTIHTPHEQEVLEPIFAMIETIEKDGGNTDKEN